MEGLTPYRTYWIAWLALLVLTLMMIYVELAGIARAIVVVFLIGAMLTKAAVIGGWFMHLKFERPALAISVVVGILVTSAFLFFLIAPDGLTALRLAPPR